jgi:phenylalanyl-tRNA synthetase alpha chain
MSNDIFKTLEDLQVEINAYPINDEASLESFRIKFLGTKNILKDLFGEIKNVPNERKKEFGQVINAVKASAEEKFNTSKEAFEQSSSSHIPSDLDLYLPSNNEKGSRHPISIVMNKIINIFSRIGFTVAEEREIEDDWHNFSAMNTPEDHPARDMQDTFYLKDSVTAY